ncbi:MAG: nicotinate phosphoribosyltransferase [Acidobacteria bacterium]|nr:MAG: nicotinate phosphoribosyltransferase [Acidobacteriota bacterium]
MPIAPSRLSLLTDLYELTMAAGYFERRLEARATFALFVRSLPPRRGFLLACGIEAALDYIEQLSFSGEEIGYLRQLPAFRTVSSRFFDFLGRLRFEGDVAAVAEGTAVFAGEPILQISAPIIQAQIVETYLLSVVNFETLIATKAARVVEAAAGRDVVEFGTRRAQGPEAGLRAARAAYLGGCAGTSNVLAGFRWGIPIAGTAAHSWTQAFPSERESFEALLKTFPQSAYLLLDTYDTLAAARMAAEFDVPIPGVRLDSGDLAALSREVRKILDRGGHRETKIMASGNLNEDKVAALVAAGTPIDSFGVGTELATSHDAPALNAIYKLVEIEAQGRIRPITKTEEGKGYFPGKKQVFRFSRSGRFDHDVLARSDEPITGARPLLQPVMRSGKRLQAAAAAQTIRAHAREQVQSLPEGVRALRNATAYRVEPSAALQELDAGVRKALGEPKNHERSAAGISRH